MDWAHWGMFYFVTFTELMLYGWGLWAILYGLYYFGRLLFNKISSMKNKE